MNGSAHREGREPSGYKIFGAVILVLLAAVLVGMLFSSIFFDQPFPFIPAPEPVPQTEALPPVLEAELQPAPGDPAPPSEQR